ncbi:LysR family transcriptional regulator [Pseudoalteromonas sp. NEC-BIFX-2020_002]|uniref:LysR substrate-binding domain-containing protein n=1 Tax=Pseudoalteromonas sp. NEC-BIFX-2020_002 TaxID=2732353 RepID=UPI0014778378|nr:LysR family transcriptional regulator [Pseudoalteromonas sp. NEC-BIFX-2020_002]
MDRIKAINIFIAVCREKSFSKVANEFELSPTMVSKYINFLEKEVNVKLLSRSTRGQKLTEAGELYLSKAAKLSAQYQQLMHEMEYFSGEPQGRIKINAPVTYGTYQLTYLISDFMDKYPDIHIDLELSDSLSDVLLDDFDMTFRVGELKDASYISKKVDEQQLIFCASPAYLKDFGIPNNINNLEAHLFLGFKPWQTHSRLKREFQIESLRIEDSKFVSNSGNCLRVAACQGKGIILQPSSLLKENLDNSTLIRILIGEEPNPRPVHLLYPAKKQLPLKIRLFIDFVSNYQR